MFVCISVKEYITVSQLSQIFGMQRVNSSSSSSTPSFQLASSESSFSSHSTACGPSSYLSAKVCSALKQLLVADNWHHSLLPALQPPTEFLLYDLLCCVSMSPLSYLFEAVAPSFAFFLWLDAFHYLRDRLSWAGMQCLPLISSAGTRTSWLLGSLSHVLHRCLQSLFPHADTGR